MSGGAGAGEAIRRDKAKGAAEGKTPIGTLQYFRTRVGGTEEQGRNGGGNGGGGSRAVASVVIRMTATQ